MGHGIVKAAASETTQSRSEYKIDPATSRSPWFFSKRFVTRFRPILVTALTVEIAGPGSPVKVPRPRTPNDSIPPEAQSHNMLLVRALRRACSSFSYVGRTISSARFLTTPEKARYPLAQPASEAFSA